MKLNPQQLWSDVKNHVITAATDEKDRAILELVCSQVMLNIKDNIIVFVCDSPYIQSLFIKHRATIMNEIHHLLGNAKDYFFITEIGTVKVDPLNANGDFAQDYTLSGGVDTVTNFNVGNQIQSNNSFNNLGNNQALHNKLVNSQSSGTTKAHLKSLSLKSRPRFMRDDVISPNKTFDNYVTDPKNTMLVAAAVSVALNPGASNYNPFYIFGDSGLGKTHLLFAIANRIKETRPDFSVVYTRAEEFIRHYVEAMSNPKILRINDQQVHFQDLYTEHNVFIVDDIQNFVKAANARDTFFDIIADFLDRPNKQLILASDVPPSNLKDFSTRLTSRFGSGVCCEVLAPSVETRQTITLSKCKELNINLSEDIINYIAMNICSNVREIEGAIKTLNTHIMANGSISFEDAVANLSSLVVSTDNLSLTIDVIKECVAKEYEVSVSSMESAERKKAVSNARAMAMALTRELIPDMSLSDIGHAFNKDHSSVHEAINRINKRKAEGDSETKLKYHRLFLSLKKE